MGGGYQPSMGGHQPSMGGSSTDYGGGISHQYQLWGGAISQVWGGIFPPVYTGSQNPQNYFQVWGGHQPTMGGASTDYGGASTDYGGVINWLWGGHQPTMGGPSAKYGGVYSHQYIQEVKIHRITSKYGGVINQLWGGINRLWGGPSAKYGGGGIFPPVCTGSQNPQNYFSNTYVLPAGPTNSKVMFGFVSITQQLDP